MNKIKRSDLVKALEQQLHRLSPSLTFNSTNSDPYSQILYIVKVSIDKLLEEKQALKSEYFKLANEHSPRSCQSESTGTFQTTTRLLDAQKELKKFEKLLQQKEKKVIDHELDLKKLSSSLDEREKKLNEEIKLLQVRSAEVDIRIKEVIRRERVITEMIEPEKAGEEFRGISPILETKFQRCNSEKLKRLKEDNFNEYWKKLSEKLNEDKKNVQLKEQQVREHMELLTKASEDLKYQIQAFETEKQIFQLEKQKFNNKRTFSADYAFPYDNTLSKFNPKRIVLGIKTQLETPFEDSHPEPNLSTFKKLVEMICDEFLTKELNLDERARKINSVQSDLKRKTDEFTQFFENFSRIKTEILTFKRETKRECEILLSRLKSQTEDLSRNMLEVENLRARVSSSIFFSSSDS